MSSIPSLPAIEQKYPAFHAGMIKRRHPRPIYHAFSLNAIGLNNSEYAVYSMIAVLANFGTRIADMKYASRRLRGWRTKKQIGRILGGLVRKGYIVRHAPRRYSLTGRVERRQGARLRPIHPEILHAAANPETAFYARFMMSIAACRKKWNRVTWRDLRRFMHCDTGTAQALFRAFQAVRGFDRGGGRQDARRAVFASTRPEWYRYVVHGSRRVIMDPRPAARGTVPARSQNVPPGVCRIGEYARLCLTSRPGGPGPDLGGRPARKQGRQSDLELAGRVARRAADRRRTRSMDAIRRDPRPARTAAAVRPHMERDNIPAGSVFESLIAGLPEGIRQKFEQMPAVRAERKRRRIQQGYRI